MESTRPNRSGGSVRIASCVDFGCGPGDDRTGRRTPPKEVLDTGRKACHFIILVAGPEVRIGPRFVIEFIAPKRDGEEWLSTLGELESRCRFGYR